ncbi:MAG: hypothetical protein DMG50_24970 [Acidobacteria bacterium]|nr:MAG: hypothetical protein DMG50_24970 [Acidobacteriota bacterium]
MIRKVLFLSCVALFLCSVYSAQVRAQNAGFVYVTNSQGSNGTGTPAILGFAVNPSSGALTPVPGSPFQVPADNGKSTLAVTPSGRFLYAAESVSGTGRVAAGYSIDPNTGALTSVPGSPFFVGGFGSTTPTWLVTHPSGKFLYIMDYSNAGIFAFAIDQNTGALTPTPNSPFSSQQAYPTALIVDASGKFAYIIGNSARTGTQASVSAYRIDSSSGALILVPGSPFLIPTDPSSTNKNGPLATWLATTPDSRFLYVSDYNQLDLWTFAIDGATGALTLSPTSPLHMPHGSNEFTIDPSGLFAYFTSLYPNSTDCANFFPYTNIYAPDSVFIYSIDQSTGALSPASSPMQAAAYQPYPVAVDVSGRFAYVVNLQGYNFDPNSSNISAYTIDSHSGALTQVFGSPFSAGANAQYTLVVTAGPNGGSSGGGTPPPPPQSIWASSATPAMPDAGADSAVELGVSFNSDVSGYITGIRFYKSPNNTGTHIGHLWSNTGMLLASATFSNETASGWQQVSFAAPVAITANTVYRASYHSTVGHYSLTSGYFASSGADNPPLHALANASSTPDGPYCYGSTSCFPANTYHSTNYWVDVLFQH